MFRKTKGGGGSEKKTGNETIGDANSMAPLNGDRVPANDYQEQLYNCCPEEALIYAAPTVDTLGDEESLSRLYRSPKARDDTSVNNMGSQDSNTNRNAASLPPHTTALMREDSVMIPLLESSENIQIPDRGIHTKTSNESVGSINRPQFKTRKQRNLIQQQRDQEKERQRLQQQQIERLHLRRRRRLTNKAKRDFQRDEDKMSVAVRRIPVGERSAFDKKLPPYLLDSESGAIAGKASPSWQHWYVLQQLSSVTHIRQLAFSKSVGLAADVFWREEDEIEDDEPENQSEGRSKRKYRGGRYRSIDPVKATTEALPKAPPLLSNKKHRLPMRTDVGFPHPSMEEITQKQAEIRRETEWEEASPRLVVLVTGDDLGTAVQEDEDEELYNREINGDEYSQKIYDKEEKSDTAKRSTIRIKRQGLPGMPWAGENLIQAKERNNRHFSRNLEQLPLPSVSLSSRDGGAKKAANMLAPPLDAIYSGTLGWRPRPFHDRPPGLNYTLVCPMSINFAIGNMEPLVCSLALYSLSKGKISEEFYFPAGDWEGKLQLDALQERLQTATNKSGDNEDTIDPGDENDLLKQLWIKRKHKAIFAHNLWALGENESGNDNADYNLYVVLQVFKVTHVDSTSAYWANGVMSNSYRKDDKKNWKKKLKRRFKTGSKKVENFDADETDVEKALYRSNAIFDAYGMQFTSPLCFGITRLFPEDCDPMSRHNMWPRGQVQQGMDLYLSPSHSESQDDFLQRLRKVVSTPPKVKASTVSDLSKISEEASRNIIVEEDESDASASLADDSTTPSLLSPLKKKKSARRNKVQKIVSKKDQAIMSSKTIEDTPLIPGSVTLFTSNLDVDFLQSMLITPPELIDKVSIKTTTNAGNKNEKPKEIILPRILVDASGDSAIMVDPKKTANSAKRSDLVRLPSTRLAEHLDSSEFREVLFLQPERQKIFEFSDHKSLLNLLYLYPKLLVINSSESGTKNNIRNHRYTVRVRMVRNLSITTKDGIIENRNEVLTSFHNPASWSGPNLLPSVYTRIPRDSCDDHTANRRQQNTDDSPAGIPLRDEFKMKLPTILDGSHFLQFSLFAVELHDSMDEIQSKGSHDSYSSGEEDECGISLSPLAEMSIPLSNSTTRDPKSGVKATTIIPNGCHRLKLGNFQLQIETRLVSSIHISDPAVAAALREFPIASKNGQLGPRGNVESFDEMVISSRLSTVGRSATSRGHENVPVKIPYPKLMASASRSALLSHFHPLFFLHLRNLTKTGSGEQDIEISEQFIVNNMQSLLVLFTRVKSLFLSPSRDYDRLRLRIFIKAIVDSFDELSYNTTGQVRDNEDDIASEFHASNSNAHTTDPEIVTEDHKEKFDGGAIRKRTSNIGIRISKTYSTLETANEVSFSRVAYGASKSDHMRLEAELGSSVGGIRTLFDDDETVATLSTMRSIRHAESQQPVESSKYILEKPSTRSPFNPKKADNNNSMTSSSTNISGGDKRNDSNDIDMAAFQQSISELQIGKRVKSAAQVMLAPCATVTPGLAAFLCKPSPRNVNASFEASELKEESNNAPNESSRSKLGLFEEQTSEQTTLPGSDLDEDDATSGDVPLSLHYSEQGIFRGTRNNMLELKFSIKQHGYIDGRSIPISRGVYVYESIMILWLHSWSDYISSTGQNSARKSEVSINFLGEGEKGNQFSMFYLQLDLLLPLILKSIILRYSQAPKPTKHKTFRCVLDKDHVFVFESFVEMLAIGLMGQAMTELQESTEHGTLLDAINNCDLIVDFIIGLFAVFHPAHMECLVSKFVMTLRKCESDRDDSLEWNKVTLHRAKCSRQLRLRTIEKLAVLPHFVALNFPQRFSTKHSQPKTKKSTWTKQCENVKSSDDGGSKIPAQDSSISDGLLPRTGWLASLLTNESLSICALSCEAVVTDVIASIGSHDSSKSDETPQRSSRSKPLLKRSDLMMFQSIAIHAISCVYELLLRRHAMDRRFQKDSSRARIAALFTKPIFEKSLASVRWLARMEATHRVRSIWMLCFVYILQEAPENLIREHIRSYSDPSDLKIHRFIRLLRLGSATFQSFIDQQRHCMFPLEIDRGISPWLLQESFNTVCATTILVVDESVVPTSSIPNEQRKMIQGILDLLLHVLTTPQSTVTHLRAVGGAIHAFEKFGTQIFLETTGGQLQHWIRIIIGLMNSTALSVRSIAVDFVVSLLCGIFDLYGNIEDVALVFATVLPEVVAREIALCSVNGLIMSFEDAERAIWPLRRSFADIEDANPLDDDRVDLQLPPVLSVFCRASQAIIDGVLVEMRLRGKDCIVVGTRIPAKNIDKYIFDADEESLFEAANFFTPETSPIQRLRWLLTLRSLHESKGHWVEAAETLIMCARTISDAIPHLNNVWRPNRFSLWSDGRRSLWLSTVGDEIGNPEQGNAQVMTFANSFLEPENLFKADPETRDLNLSRPTLPHMCSMLISISKDAVSMYSREGGMDAFAYTQLESLLKIIMGVLDAHKITSFRVGGMGSNTAVKGKQYVEEVTCLRKVIASITADMTKLAEKLLLVAEDVSTVSNPSDAYSDDVQSASKERPYYVRVLLSGKKPRRFEESTSLPTFIEWDKPCICRVPKRVVQETMKSGKKNLGLSAAAICDMFGKSIKNGLLQDLDATEFVFSTGTPDPDTTNADTTYVNIDLVRPECIGSTTTGLQDGFGYDYRRFLYRQPIDPRQGVSTTYVKMTVAIAFPCPLSRQRSMLTKEFNSSD